MGSVFISYRKQGVDKVSSLHLAEDLREALGQDAVFRDEKGLELGRFEDQLLRHVQACEAMVAVIGPAWVERINELQSEKDWVRRELEIGLQRQILMVPLLLEEVGQPEESDLPPSLRTLLEYQIVRFHPMCSRNAIIKQTPGSCIAKQIRGIFIRLPTFLAVHVNRCIFTIAIAVIKISS